MSNAEEFPGQWPGFARARTAYRRPRFGAGRRIRYAHRGALPGDEHFRAAWQGAAVHHEDDGDTENLTDAGALAGGGNGAGPGGDLGGGDLGTGDLGGGLWLTEFPPGSRQGDLWVLVCGGVRGGGGVRRVVPRGGRGARAPAQPGGRGARGGQPGLPLPRGRPGPLAVRGTAPGGPS